MNTPLAQAFRYNRWANLSLLESCRNLSEPQLDLRAPATSGSIRELLTHIVGGEQTFLLRTKGRQHEGELTRRSTWPGIDALLEIASTTGDQLVAIAEGLEEDVPVELPYLGKTYRFPVSFFLVHALEHATEHRTEVKVALESIGVATPNLDGWEFAAAMGFGQEV